MYVPRQFREEDPAVLAAAVRGIGLATLVTAPPGGALHATHLPMVLKETDGALVLEGHVARPNPHWRDAEAGPSLAVFQGPQAYVSPSWYPAKREHGKVVPTWNYIAVHARGAIEVVHDGGWLRAHLDDLTRLKEAGREAPWEVADAPADFIDELARAIVGFRMRVDSLEGAWKLIQHRAEGDRLGTIAGLGASDAPNDRAVAEAMRALEAARG